MNVFLLGMCVAMVIYIIIGIVVSRSIQGAEDFYVAGRRAPVILIAGSMIASYTSTGMFMGDAATSYEGAFAPLILFAGMQSAGYIIGAVFFGRYLRRSRCMTIPEFFGQRFHSSKMQSLAAITAIVMMTVYLLSVTQGIGTLMSLVTGLPYNGCIVIALLVAAFISITSGSKGVLITDTLMATIFTLSMIAGAIVIARNVGGWYDTLKTLAADPATRDMLSASGRLVGKDGTGAGPLGYTTPTENIMWGLNYGVVWMSVCMVGPWQSSRYQMARNEHVVVRSSFYSALGVFIMEFLTCIAAVMVNRVNPDLVSSHVLLWAAMNLMPTLLGVILLTGVLSAGISSATTFLSLVGTSFAYDVRRVKDEKDSIMNGRIAMVAAGIIVALVALYNSPSIFWIMFLGGAIVAASWMPVAVACIFSRRVTKTGAFAGMLFGFLGCFCLRLYTALSGTSLPAWLDPSIVGMVLNVVAMTIGSALTQVTKEEKEAREALFVMPESEKDPREVAKTMFSARLSVAIGPIVVALLLLLWVVPFAMAK